MLWTMTHVKGLPDPCYAWPEAGAAGPGTRTGCSVELWLCPGVAAFHLFFPTDEPGPSAGMMMEIILAFGRACPSVAVLLCRPSLGRPPESLDYLPMKGLHE